MRPAPLPLATPLPARAAGTVTNCSDSDPGSLREAITTASSGATITFQPGPNCTEASAIKLTTGTLTLSTNTTIDATGATIAVDGNNAVSVFTVSSGVAAAISGLTIQHGFTAGNGGGIAVNAFGSLTITRVAVVGNTAQPGNGAPGISLDAGTLTVIASTIANNSGGAAVSPAATT